MDWNAQFEPRDKAARTLPSKTKENMTGLRSKIRWQIRWSARSRAFLFRTGMDHPSALWHYLKDNRRYRLVKLRIPSATAKRVAEIRAEYEALAVQGQFKEKWFDVNIVPWCVTFSRIFDRADPVRILEIGAWEGRSTLFLLTYFTQAHLTAVDTWTDMDEYQYNATPDLRDLEVRFDGNVAPFADRLTKRKGSSLHVLPQLLDEQQKFDVIYVDGSHFVDDVLTDGITAWRLLKQGGILIFDDFLSNHYPRWRANPAWAINLFLKYHAGEYNILSVYYQIILQKKITFTDRATPPPSSLTTAIGKPC
jgi:predicted O-methyltransferase YrrM